MLKDFFIVGLGSFFGGGARFVVSKIVQSWTVLPFPLGTFAVRLFLGTQLWRNMVNPVDKTNSDDGVLRWFHNVFHIHE